jgi:hypothetical protein
MTNPELSTRVTVDAGQNEQHRDTFTGPARRGALEATPPTPA